MCFLLSFCDVVCWVFNIIEVEEFKSFDGYLESVVFCVGVDFDMVFNLFGKFV